jgi:hypothetical protein
MKNEGLFTLFHISRFRLVHELITARLPFNNENGWHFIYFKKGLLFNILISGLSKQY